jgi:hypothetical protein
MPAADTAAEAEHFASALGGRIAWGIEAFGARVAMVELAAGPPHLLLADHLEGERPILVYRVASLDGAIDELTRRGATAPNRFEIPFGPCAELVTPAGHRVAFYERTRPEMGERFAERRDF